MKQSVLSLALISSLALTLTACGGGSSGGSTAQPSTPVVKPNPTTNLPKVQISGEAIVIDTNDNSEEMTYKTINTNNLNTLTVDGKSFSIGSPNIISGAFTEMQDGSHWRVISGTHVKHSKYGFYRDKGSKMEYFFYQGEKTPTTNLPTGVVNYTGRSIYACKTCNSEIITGTSKFTADFGKKTLTGSISNEKTSNVALNATISGNTFSGKNGADTETRGAFFGDKAQEISGTYLNEKQDFAGAFGATKQ